MKLFKGLSAFPLTPNDTDGKLIEDTLCVFLERIHEAGADSIGLLGSTGGYAFLTREQRLHTINTAVRFIGGRTPIIVGVGALRTDDAQALARDAADAGADGLLLAPVSYTPLTQDEVFQHFKTVAETTDLPLCIYNNPGTTKFIFNDELIARLASVKNISAIKMPLPANGDYEGAMSKLRAETPPSFAIGYSGDWGAADALLAGADAWYSVVAGLLPDPALALTRAAQSGNNTEAERINAAFTPLWDLFKTHSSFRVMYVIADLLGLAKIEPPRPILPLGTEAYGQVEAALEHLREIEN
ncbi:MULTISPECIES: dihydrodipicolinate synthase family protein [Brucella]|uniref:Dihydrodipicolinate synthase n=1 Tax=Brucella lupini TaxID=255457 RepID=A0A256GTW6_9HYPH|nr:MULTISPECIES: dihydrodipicolinate synthase family protein [Brucella/Ochrobactrum group]QOD65204.1 dihydrodipicolinate synthase family protein [Ochrobactrum sp. MT180101]RNL48016.1 dihydrodipicolinate synthase family protein [Ochrobactrum sp. MH181795]KAB2704527.1 dihydrodipicolinate synthase family protein [Brucella lupini]KAB2724644.1 dihydrodipicolinate synthase family protein [Brucella anthropi]KAB2738996.1 dihydrodipicolinate synthase family protein [Brucella anthropi]